jgi:hypothetical protein
MFHFLASRFATFVVKCLFRFGLALPAHAGFELVRATLSHHFRLGAGRKIWPRMNRFNRMGKSPSQWDTG